MDKIKTSYNEYQDKLETKQKELNGILAEQTAVNEKLEDKKTEMTALLETSNKAITAKEEALEALAAKDKKIAELQKANESAITVQAELKKAKLAAVGERDKALKQLNVGQSEICLLYTSPSPRDQRGSRMPSSA